MGLESIDTSIPHSARVWNHWLGGKDNYPVDRAVGDQVEEAFPGIVTAAKTSRRFLGRSVRFLAGEAGIRQFLDVGTGLPTVGNTHEVAQRVAPEARIVYVDNDPLVLTHARALLTSTPEGATRYVDADLGDPELILREAAELLDLSRPVALILNGVMGHVADTGKARGIVSDLLAPLPPGSYLSLSDGTDTDEASVEAHRRYNESGAIPYNLRSPEGIASFFEGLELVEPGLVSFTRWRPEATSPWVGEPDVPGLCGVGRKP
ncbi:SAM-dependent methyltransferase [Spirillospora sp. NPDC047279]|uniref:SAM-dependent methyltransferase n=1 Tax=Spirillospora sp. NPDC047279 TaxID=3155478 RepID=UPI0033E7CB25